MRQIDGRAAGETEASGGMGPLDRRGQIDGRGMEGTYRETMSVWERQNRWTVGDWVIQGQVNGRTMVETGGR